MKRFLLTFILTAIIPNAKLIAQSSDDVKITITVKDEKNKPVPGAVILFDDVRQKRWTNSKGVFKAKLDKAPKEICAFSPKIGVQKVPYNGNKNVLIIIREKNDIYRGETPLSKSDNTIQFRNIYDYMRGKVPGVNISGNNTINIRGFNSVNGSITPLFILNNTAVDQSVFGDIVPTTIKQIRVLKGPEAATYGSRGANGVIIVETF